MFPPLMLSGIEQRNFFLGLWIDRFNKVVAVFIAALTGEGKIAWIIGTP
jgi:hypothetical protein